ncbi:MAG: glycosyltransferase [Paludibacteraceae bacterium]|nr:glycosyltransferase [Paludibacteraceae bacterium]
MNILQITNYECASASANDNTGINRVVTALSTYFVQVGDTCFNAYFNANSRGLSEVFSAGLQLALPLNEDELRSFLTTNQIDRIVINVSNIEYIRVIPTINKIAHTCHAKTIYCFHFMPGFEECSYTAFSLLYYNLTHKGKVIDSFRKWLITISRPISSKIIRAVIRKRYAQPLETSDKVVVFSQEYVKQYLNIARSTRDDKFVVVHNPLPFKDYINKEELQHKEKEVIIVGRLYEPTKRISYALRVWRMIEKNPLLSDWKLTIIGEGISGGYYKWLIHKYHLKNVVLAGRQDPQPYYKKASILLSISSHESWPMVIMESMPQGVIPGVFNSYAATSEIIDHNKNGIIVPDNDLYAMYESLADLMQNHDKRLQMGAAAIEKAKSFDMTIIGELWRKDTLQAPSD